MPHADSLLGRDYEVSPSRFTVVGVDPERGLRIQNSDEAVWITFAFWQELCESGLLTDAAPLVRGMALKTWMMGGAR